MAAPYNPPKKGKDFAFTAPLPDMAIAGSFKINPTIAAGDFKVDIDGAGFNNLATLPVVRPAGGAAVYFILSAAEMAGNVITIVGIDTAPKEWSDFHLCIPTTA